MTALLVWVYLGGVVWALVRSDAQPLARVVLAALWPLGPLAFVCTLTLLVLASLIAFPVVGAIAGLAAVLAWWLLR